MSTPRIISLQFITTNSNISVWRLTFLLAGMRVLPVTFAGFWWDTLRLLLLGMAKREYPISAAMYWFYWRLVAMYTEVAVLCCGGCTRRRQLQLTVQEIVDVSDPQVAFPFRPSTKRHQPCLSVRPERFIDQSRINASLVWLIFQIDIGIFDASLGQWI